MSRGPLNIGSPSEYFLVTYILLWKYRHRNHKYFLSCVYIYINELYFIVTKNNTNISVITFYNSSVCTVVRLLWVTLFFTHYYIDVINAQCFLISFIYKTIDKLFIFLNLNVSNLNLSRSNYIWIIMLLFHVTLILKR